MFKTLLIITPFVEALLQMPHYAKILKELLINKKKSEEMSIVTLSEVTISEECSAILTNQIPKKEKDPGSFIVPCTIGVVDERALDD